MNASDPTTTTRGRGPRRDARGTRRERTKRRRVGTPGTSEHPSIEYTNIQTTTRDAHEPDPPPVRPEPSRHSASSSSSSSDELARSTTSASPPRIPRAFVGVPNAAPAHSSLALFAGERSVPGDSNAPGPRSAPPRSPPRPPPRGGTPRPRSSGVAGDVRRRRGGRRFPSSPGVGGVRGSATSGDGVRGSTTSGGGGGGSATPAPGPPAPARDSRSRCTTVTGRSPARDLGGPSGPPTAPGTRAGTTRRRRRRRRPRSPRDAGPLPGLRVPSGPAGRVRGGGDRSG